MVLSSVCSILRTAPGVSGKRATSYIKDRVAAVAYEEVDFGKMVIVRGNERALCSVMIA